MLTEMTHHLCHHLFHETGTFYSIDPYFEPSSVHYRQTNSTNQLSQQPHVHGLEMSHYLV